MEHAFTIKALCVFFLSIFPYDFPRKIPLTGVGLIQTDSRLEKRHRNRPTQRAVEKLTFLSSDEDFQGVKGF